IPFLVVMRCWVRDMGEIGEAIVRGNAATIAAEEASYCLVQEAVVLKFGIRADNRILVGADSLCCVTVGQENLAIVPALVRQLAAQFDPQHPRHMTRDAPCWRIHDSQRQHYKRAIALSFTLAHNLRHTHWCRDIKRLLIFRWRDVREEARFGLLASLAPRRFALGGLFLFKTPEATQGPSGLPMLLRR